MKIDLTIAKRIRKPNIWGTYKCPIDNLIHAILIQAICDANGYVNTSHHYETGEDAQIFLSEMGLQFYQHLSIAQKNPVSVSADTSRKYYAKRGLKNG